MEYLTESLSSDWQAFLQYLPRLVYAAVLFALLLYLGRQLGRMAARLLRRGGRDTTYDRLLQSLVMLGTGAVALVLSLGVLGLQGLAATLVATGGIAAIVLGFAFKEIGENLLAGFFLTFSRPFERGDLVRTGELTGTVRGIELRHVHIRTADACDVFVPSAEIFREPLYNYTRDGLRRPSFTIGVAYHDAPEQVLEVLAGAARSVHGVLEEPAPAAAIKAFSDNVIVYEVMFWVDLNERTEGLLAMENRVKIACWRALSESGMTFSTDVSAAIDIRSVPPAPVATPQQT